MDALGEDLYVLSDEFDGWDDGKLRIDLLCLDRNARLVVIELKRDFADSDIQALRYAAMASSMTADQAIQSHRQYIEARRVEALRPGGGPVPTQFPEPAEAEQRICKFLGRSAFTAFEGDVRIILASMGFTKAVTTTALWLLEHGIEIRCVSLQPYRYPGITGLLLNIQQSIPVPDTGDYQIRVAIKNREERSEQAAVRTRQQFWLRVGENSYPGLGKGRLALQAVRSLIADFDVSPAEITANTFDGKRPLFVGFPGDLSSDDFTTVLAQEARPWVGRCFAKDAELVKFGGQTYALTSQWGLETEDFVRELIENLYGRFPVSCDFGPESAAEVEIPGV